MSTDNSESKFDWTVVKISSKTPGWDLDAWKYVPKTRGNAGKAPFPVIIMYANYFRRGLRKGVAYCLA